MTLTRLHNAFLTDTHTTFFNQTHLGGTLQLIHGWIVRCFARGTFSGTNQLSQSFSDISDCVYQDHLKETEKTLSQPPSVMICHRLYPVP